MRQKEQSAERIQKLPPYLFAEIDLMKQNALEKGVDVIDMGVGDPDIPSPQIIIDALIQSVKKPDVHHYSSYSGLSTLRKAFAEWFYSRYKVQLDHNKEVLPLLGSKEGIGHIFMACINPGDEILIPDPGYPVYTAGTIMAEATPVYFSLREENGFLPVISELEQLVTPKTKMLWLNYPNNPTAAVASRDVFQDIAAFAKKHGIMICHDAAYSELIYDDEKSISFLEVPNGKETAIEFHSLSKTFCMTGWRVGFAIGNSEIISALAKVKTNLDSGIFIPVQEAAITALNKGYDEAKKIKNIFQKRRDDFVKGLQNLGWQVSMPPATFYVWAHVPRQFTSMEFTSLLLREAGIVCTPGIGFGKTSDGFVRMSLTMPEERLIEALERMKKIDIDWK